MVKDGSAVWLHILLSPYFVCVSCTLHNVTALSAQCTIRTQNKD